MQAWKFEDFFHLTPIDEHNLKKAMAEHLQVSYHDALRDNWAHSIGGVPAFFPCLLKDQRVHTFPEDLQRRPGHVQLKTLSFDCPVRPSELNIREGQSKASAQDGRIVQSSERFKVAHD